MSTNRTKVSGFAARILGNLWNKRLHRKKDAVRRLFSLVMALGFWHTADPDLLLFQRPVSDRVGKRQKPIGFQDRQPLAFVSQNDQLIARGNVK